MLVQTDHDFDPGPIARIPLGKGLFALCDPDWFDYLNQFNWYAKKSFSRYYPCRKVTENGKVYFVRMHRVVANTPDDLICHHVNKNTFDVRRLNLQNMSQFEHQKLYSWR